MSHILMIDDNNSGTPIARATVNERIHLAAFGVIWALANMILVDIIFDRVFNEQPFHMVQLLNVIH